MKKISYWAKHNPKTARWIIVLGHLLVVCCGISLGFLLPLFDWEIPRFTIVAIAGIAAITFILYPQKGSRKNIFQHTYRRQKVGDFSLVFSSFLMIALGISHVLLSPVPISNYQETPPKAIFIVQKTTPLKDVASRKSISTKFKETVQDLKRQIKYEWKEMSAEMRKDDAQNIGLKIFLTIGIVAIALVLTYFLALLSCHLNCTGFPVLAVIVLALGLLGIILLGIVAIKNIWKKESNLKLKDT